MLVQTIIILIMMMVMYGGSCAFCYYCNDRAPLYLRTPWRYINVDDGHVCNIKIFVNAPKLKKIKSEVWG